MFRVLKPRQLLSLRSYYTVKNEQHSPDIPKQLLSRIKATGPITVAEYMRQVLTSPQGGYYINKNSIGKQGDFITSPELSQMFGEMIAIWFLNEWSKLGAPKPFQIVELGPGRGSLSEDILRIFAHFQVLNEYSLNLVEISPFYSDVQAARLCTKSENVLSKNAPFYKEGMSKRGIPVKWTRSLDNVPNCFTLFIAHEFFDALPIHKFQKTPAGYREILIDIGPNDTFRYVSAREDTPASKLFISAAETRAHLEISPESSILVQKIAQRVETDGGIALIADYGHNGDGTDTFRAFKRHNLHDPLAGPGSADLTADVDFKLLKKAAEDTGGVLTFGPTTQREFLLKMGMEQRFDALRKHAKTEDIEGLTFSYKMMVEGAQMGERFKFLAMLPKVVEPIIKRVPVAGFS